MKLLFYALISCTFINFALAEESISKNIIILQGGNGSEIKARKLPFNETEWSSKILTENKIDELSQIHLDYINSGAKIIMTSTYAIAVPHIGRNRVIKEGKELINRAIKATVLAKEKSNQKDIKIAGSISPMFGSYRPDLFNEKEANKLYKITVAPLIENDNIDILLMETISSIQEAKFLVKFINKEMKLRNINKPYWISFTLDDNMPRLRSGEGIADIIKVLELVKSNPPQAILFNCSQPEMTTLAIKELKKINGQFLIGAFANRFQKVKDLSATEATPLRDLSPDQHLDFTKQWVADGAEIIGGCCGVGPDYIKAVSKYFNNKQ